MIWSPPFCTLILNEDDEDDEIWLGDLKVALDLAEAEHWQEKTCEGINNDNDDGTGNSDHSRVRNKALKVPECDGKCTMPVSAQNMDECLNSETTAC